MRRSIFAMAAQHFDYLVIGGGSGGVASARRAAAYGARVAIIEQSQLGGTCVNVGCVPKKVMFHAADIASTLSDAKHYGFVTGDVQFQWEALKQSRDRYIHRLNGVYQKLLEDNRVTIINGHASFKDNRTVVVNSQEYSAEHILIAVGGKPEIPSFPGVEHCITSDGFFNLSRQPSRVAVIGAGYIAVEIAGVFKSLGTDTSLFYRNSHVLRKFDTLLSDGLMKELTRAGVNMHGGSVPASVVKHAQTNRYSLHLANGSAFHDFDEVLVATGRVPATASLNLAASGVDVILPKGVVAVDEYQNTSVAGVYALGDVCGKVELTPMAIAAGRRLADRLFGGVTDAKADYDDVPTVIFTHPPIGTVGLSEAEARARYAEADIKVYRTTFTSLYYGPWDVSAHDKPKTSMKLICLGPEERVIGLHVIGQGADEMLQGFGVAMKLGATKADFDRCVAIHPTSAEEFVTLHPWGMSGRNTPATRSKL